MRAVVSAACLIGAMFALQGCGGGGGKTTTKPTPAPTPAPPGPAPGPSPGGSCLNPSIDMVTQSVTANTILTAASSVGKMTFTEKGTSQGTTMFDMEQWNARIDQTADLKMTGLPMTPAMETKTESKMILDVAKKMVVVYEKVTNVTSGKVLLPANCSILTVEKMPSPEILTFAWKAIKSKLQQSATCGGNDGTYDTWKMTFDHKKGDKWPIPVPSGTIPPMDVSVEADMQMSKDYLMHYEAIKVRMQADKIDGQGPMSVSEDATTTVSKASLNGPTAADLDYSSWGTCTPRSIPPTELNKLKGLYKDGKNTMQNAIITTLLLAMDKEGKEVVV